jgi:hypothetical protein
MGSESGPWSPSPADGKMLDSLRICKRSERRDHLFFSLGIFPPFRLLIPAAPHTRRKSAAMRGFTYLDSFTANKTATIIAATVLTRLAHRCRSFLREAFCA